MRFDAVTALAGAFMYPSATCVASAVSYGDVEEIVAGEVQTMLPGWRSRNNKNDTHVTISGATSESCKR
jgi:hypothetical protein